MRHNNNHPRNLWIWNRFLDPCESDFLWFRRKDSQFLFDTYDKSLFAAGGFIWILCQFVVPLFIPTRLSLISPPKRYKTTVTIIQGLINQFLFLNPPTYVSDRIWRFKRLLGMNIGDFIRNYPQKDEAAHQCLYLSEFFQTGQNISPPPFLNVWFRNFVTTEVVRLRFSSTDGVKMLKETKETEMNWIELACI